MSKTAWLFPGQGAQCAGMGKDFYENSAAAAQIFDMASRLLNLDMKALCFEENDQLDLTEYTQAALVTTCLAIVAVLTGWGLEPDVSAGLSLGEYCSLVVAGGMKTEDAITTVRKRGILMQNAVPNGEGGMAAVIGMKAEDIEQVLEDIPDVTIANYNCPGQIVITGYTDRVDEASEKLKEAGARMVSRLNVSGPFHSPLLKGAGEELGKVLETVQLSPLKIPYVTNVTGGYVRDISETKTLLAQQVSSSVRWEQGIRAMLDDGVDTFIEIGPGKTLAGFMKRIDRKVTMINVSTWSDLEKLQDNVRR